MATGGKAATTAPADTKCQEDTHCPFSDNKPAVIGCALALCVSTVAQKKSFHMNVKTRTANAAIAGRTSGKITNMNILYSETPSMRALSTNSMGNERIKFLMNRVQNPV